MEIFTTVCDSTLMQSVLITEINPIKHIVDNRQPLRQ